MNESHTHAIQSLYYLDCMFRVRPSKSMCPAWYCSITSLTSYGFKASLNFFRATKYFICVVVVVIDVVCVDHQSSKERKKDEWNYIFMLGRMNRHVLNDRITLNWRKINSDFYTRSMQLRSVRISLMTTSSMTSRSTIGIFFCFTTIFFNCPHSILCVQWDHCSLLFW